MDRKETKSVTIPFVGKMIPSIPLAAIDRIIIPKLDGFVSESNPINIRFCSDIDYIDLKTKINMVIKRENALSRINNPIQIQSQYWAYSLYLFPSIST